MFKSELDYFVLCKMRIIPGFLCTSQVVKMIYVKTDHLTGSKTMFLPCVVFISYVSVILLY